MINFKKILVPVDFSPEAEFALEWAVDMAKDRPGASISLMSVPLPLAVGEGPYDIPATMEPLREEARRKLAAWRARVPPNIPTEVIIGATDPAQDIVTHARIHQVDVIVMTTKGRRGLDRLVHPNLTETVVRRAPCPVIALHLNETTERLIGAGDSKGGDVS